MNEARVVLCGMGVGGKDMAEIMLKKRGVKLVGAVALDSSVGKDVGEVIGIDEKLGVTVSNDLDTVLSQTKPNVMLQATKSYTREVYPDIMKALEAGVNVITISEQVTNPWIHDPDLARNMDDAAKKHNVSVHATGLNPGFYLDALPLLFSGICTDIERIRVSRIADMTEWVRKSPTVAKNFGIGCSPEETQRKLDDGSITLHVGLPETIHQIADALGWTITDIQEEREALPSKIVRDVSPAPEIQIGQTYGCRYDGWGIVNGEKAILLEGTLAINPTQEVDGIEPGYTLWIEGIPDIKVSIEGITEAAKKAKPGRGTTIAARAVNWIPYILAAKPGLLTPNK